MKALQFNQPNSLNNFPKNNQNYKPPKINKKNNQGYSSNDNINSGYSSHTGGNIYAKVNENNKPKPKNNIANKAAIFNPPPKINPPVYAPKTSGNINQAYSPKTSGDMPLFPSNYTPNSATNNNPTSTEPLISTSKLDIKKNCCNLSECCDCCECGNCCECCECCECGDCCECCECDDCCECCECDDICESCKTCQCCESNCEVGDIYGPDKCCVIFFCICLAALQIYDIIITFIKEKNNYILFLIPDFLYLFFAIFEPITLMRVR